MTRGRESERGEPGGPVDPQVSFITVQSMGGRPIALLRLLRLH